MAKSKPKKGKNGTKSQKSLYLENELWRRIDAKAKEDSRSLNNFLENFLTKTFTA